MSNDEEQEDLEERSSSNSSSSSGSPFLPWLPMYAAIMMMFTVTSINSNRTSRRSSYDRDENKLSVHPTYVVQAEERDMSHAEKLKNISLNQNYVSASDDETYIHVEPRVAGQNADIVVMNRSNLEGRVEKITLYEDGVEVASSDSGFMTHTVTHTNASKHEYNAYIKTDRDSAVTHRVEVDFSGERVDFKPYFLSWSTSGEEAGKAATIHLQGKDIGDDSGIEKVLLFEDGKQIAEFAGEEWNIHTVAVDSEQSRTYHAEAYDKTGNKVVSKNERIHFLGEALAPEISWFHAGPEVAGKSAIFSISANDDDNHDELAGIESIILLEDGTEIARETEKSLYHTVICDTKGVHSYHAVAKNKNGKIAISDKKLISFAGEALAPEVNWFSGPYSGKVGKTAAFSISADDDSNYGDEKGIAAIKLYEDGKVISEKKDNWTTFIVAHEEAGKHTYKVEIVNTAGKSTYTKEETVKFSGEDLPPEVGWWAAHYYDDEHLARFSIDGKDTHNFGENAGIAKITLYENGMPIQTEEDNSLVTMLQRPAGKYEYHAEIINNGGKAIKTDIKTLVYQ